MNEETNGAKLARITDERDSLRAQLDTANGEIKALLSERASHQDLSLSLSSGDYRREKLCATLLDVSETLRALAGTGVPSALEASAVLSHELTMLTTELSVMRRAERESRR